MQTAVTNLLDKLATVLGPLSPFTKAVVPAVLAVLVAVVNSLFSGAIDGTSLTIAGSGLVLALVVFLVPNKPKLPAAAVGAPAGPAVAVDPAAAPAAPAAPASAKPGKK